MQGLDLFVEWEARVRDYRKSGLKASDWCALNGFPVSRLRYWVVKVNKLTEVNKAEVNRLTEVDKTEVNKLANDYVSSPNKRQTGKNEKVCDQNAGFGWAAVEIVDTHIESKIAICIGAARIEVASGFDKSLLSDVLAVVTRSC